MKNYNIQKSYQFAVVLFMGIISVLGYSSKSQELKNNSENNINKIQEVPNEVLIPMPTGNFESAFSKVNNERNPFKDPSESEITIKNSRELLKR